VSNLLALDSRRTALPGFGPTLGMALFYLCLLVLLPLSAVVIRTSTLSWAEFWETVTAARALASYRLTFGAAAVAAGINVIFGVLVAWVLVRHPMRGTRLIDALVDLPFALPTAVAGIALTSLYSATGPFGRLLEPFGLAVAFTPIGVIVALTFIGLPFVVRTVAPVLEELDADVEAAAASLGASRRQVFTRVIAPTLAPAVLTGFTLAFARALGEYGSVVFIAGNLPMHTEITTLLIMTKLEQYDYAGATALAAVMLGASFTLLVLVNTLHAWSRRRG
jgi:sulfate/thiosulfate transport system permease protein